ncbi:MAG: YbgF trimerization domain-containing protein [Betaproteobacteria bacterium]
MSTLSTDRFGALRSWVVCAAALAATGCATQDQLRNSDVSHDQDVEALRAELRHTQDTVHTLEVALAETRARVDGARTQADSALATSREFLSNLVAVREEQRRQLDENGAAFSDLRRKTADFDIKLQAQQRAMDQGYASFSEAIRRLAVVEAGLQDMSRRSGALETRARLGQESDEATNRQLVALRKQVEDTRSVMSSEGLLELMRGLEDVRRSSASLRGSIEELEKAQSDAATQTRNFYVDLDARVRLLKQASLPTRPEAGRDEALAAPPKVPLEDGGASASVPAQPDSHQQ